MDPWWRYAGLFAQKPGTARISLIELKTTDRGVQWLADWLNERYKTAACVVIDGRNGVDFLVEKISPVWKYRAIHCKAIGKRCDSGGKSAGAGDQ